MKNTKTNKIRRTIASLLAAAMVMTTAASFAASADELPSASASNTVTVDQAIDLGVGTLFTGIEEFVPGGKFLVPFLKPIVNDLLGKGKELSLDDINAKIDDMFKKVEDLNDDLRDSFENITAIQSLDTFQFKTFNSQIQEIISQIEVIRKLDISEENKYAQIAALVNNNTCWTEVNNVFVTFSNLTQGLKRASLTKKCDIFKLLYDHYAKSSMFSGEALDKANAAADLIMTDYIAGYYALLQCLSAQSKVCNMTAEQKSRIDPTYLARITNSQALITKKVNELKNAVFGDSTITTEEYISGYDWEVTGEIDPDEYWLTFSLSKNSSNIKRVPIYSTRTVVTYDETSVIGRYRSFKNTKRNLFINKGTANQEMDTRVSTVSTTSLPYHSCDEGGGREYPIKKAVEDFKSQISPKAAFSDTQIKAIAAFVNGKGITIRQYLKNNGFNTDALPGNTYALTSGAYHDLVTAGNIGKAAIGTATWHAMFKGINIDEVNPTEKEVTYWHTGCHLIGIAGSWNYGEQHNILVTASSTNTNTNSSTSVYSWLLETALHNGGFIM